MGSTKHAIIVTIFASMQGGKNHYTKASVNAIQQLLRKYHGVEVKRRWLFYCLRHIEDAGLLRRKQRYRRGENGDIRQISSMISFTLKGVRYLVSNRISGAKELLARMISWWQRQDDRFPDPGPEVEKFIPLEEEKNLRRLRELVFNL